ncbi:hypothetical protein BHC47_05025 [Snodgrassella alvi]|uniref:GmrSD restriction endonucleases N-terminal domain-containing protein n=1 Tax=Snodgrassella alvi TaxID=1196083 RepID=A0A2N9Y489_9NEIS|nr:DUF262 domain-containing protein [Snodgrassella alvi]PIT62456.1 hypothetical protein BHC47_05025 [Snodgrassella alvi]PIT64387.1 hypothetical protein BHC56_04690 [Snodgrassella alvi]
MSLKKEIDEARLQIHTDSYPMSIGELVNLYEDNELDINPDFQRLYRWNITQKSRLIESIFLGIPLPSIFVSQRDDGVWDVVDGLQRIATILSFMGKLKDMQDADKKYFEATKTKYLPSLYGKKWTDLDLELQRIFKREKIDIKIIKRESEQNAKFELFQRLNTGGSKLSAQEVRNCLLLMINKSAFEYVKKLSNNPDFLATLPISDKKSEEASYEEYVIRYFIQQHPNNELRANNENIGPYFDEAAINLFNSDSKFQYEHEEAIFKNTFQIINKALGEDAFKKYNFKERKYKGPISTPIFEIMTIIIANKIRQKQKITNEYIEKFSKQASEEIQMIPDKTRPIEKMRFTLEIANKLFKND